MSLPDNDRKDEAKGPCGRKNRPRANHETKARG